MDHSKTCAPACARASGDTRRIPAQRYDVPPRDIDFLVSELRTLLESRSFLSSGPHVERFETEFAAAHGASYAVATSNGTSALEGVLRAIGVRGADVIVPTNTFAATAFAVIHAGGRPVFADVLPDLTLDPDDAARRATPRTRAIVTVHIGGLISPATLRVADLCSSLGIPLIEDAAHAAGSTLDGRAAGSFGVAAAFSFFSTKVITTGEGGMVLTSDRSIAQTVRLLRDQAKIANANRHERVGANWRMTELQGLLGLTQVRRLGQFISNRRAVATRYDELLGEMPWLEPLTVPAGVGHNFYKYVAFLAGGQPAALAAVLAHDDDVFLSGFVYDIPLHRQPVFREFANGPLPSAEELCASHICLPIYPSLEDDDIVYVVASLKRHLHPSKQFSARF